MVHRPWREPVPQRPQILAYQVNVELGKCRRLRVKEGQELPVGVQPPADFAMELEPAKTFRGNGPRQVHTPRTNPRSRAGAAKQGPPGKGIPGQIDDVVVE